MKKEIVERLLKEGRITFDEALALMEVQETVVKIETITIPAPQMPLQPYYPIYPNYPLTGDFWYGSLKPHPQLGYDHNDSIDNMKFKPYC